MKINWQFILRKSLWIYVLGALIAVGISLFPMAECAIAGTCNQPSDKWCGTGKCCGMTGGVRVYGPSCSPLDYQEYPYNCDPKSRNCNFSNWAGEDPGLQMRVHNGRQQVLLPDCDWQTKEWRPGVWAYVDCCSGNNNGGGGRICTPKYAPPTIDDTYTVFPPNPVVWTQEQPPYGQALGMTINDIRAHGGTDTSCRTGRQANITSVTINLTLTQKSIDWILNELAQRYINVTIKDTYPKQPERPDATHPSYSCSFSPLAGAGSANAELDCQFFRPLDPGEYAINVTACQSDGQCTTKTLPQPVKVWLLESTLTVP